MIERIILNIKHADPYSAYLCMTASLSNTRVVPFVDASDEKIRRTMRRGTVLVNCLVIPWEPEDDRQQVSMDARSRTIYVMSGSYLRPDGSVDFDIAERVRDGVGNLTEELLLSARNQQDAFHTYFPLLWTGRNLIQATPELCYVPYPHNFSGSHFGSIAMLGAILKAMETDVDCFRLKLPGGCSCGECPFITGYEMESMGLWAIRTRCPVCGEGRTVKAKDFPRYHRCIRSIEKADVSMSGQGYISRLTILDVIDELKKLLK